MGIFIIFSIFIIFLLWTTIVRFTRKSGQSLIVHIYAPWIKGRNEYIDSQVEFQPVDEERIRDVTTYYALLIYRYFAYVIYL